MTKHDLVRLSGVLLAVLLALWGAAQVQAWARGHYSLSVAHNAPWVVLTVAANLLLCLPVVLLGRGARRRWHR